MYYLKGSKPGFTLIELLVTVALIALILGTAAAYITSSQYGLRTAAPSIRAALQKARLEAIKRNRSVYLDFSGPAGSYILWTDLNGDGNYDAPNELIETIQASPNISFGAAPVSAGGPASTNSPPNCADIPSDGVSLGGQRAKFDPDGSSSAGTVYIYIPSSPSAGTYAIVLSSIGRCRIWYFQPGASSWKQL